MRGVHTSHIRWVIGDVISVIVGQDERNIEEIVRYDHRHSKTPEKVHAIKLVITGVMHQEILSSKPTPKGVTHHIRIMDTA